VLRALGTGLNIEREIKNSNDYECMRITSVLSVTTFIFFICWSCSPKAESSSDSTNETDRKEWKGMENFHVLMAESFHPYRDSANLKPVKRLAGKMIVSANSWMNEKLPKKVDTDQVKQLLIDLHEEAQALADLVEVGDDLAIGESLTSMHDTFHLLQEEWNKKEN